MRRSSEGGGRGVGVRLAACLRGKVRVLAHQFDRDPPKQVRSSSSSPVRRASLPFFAQQTMGAHSVESSATLRRSCPVHARAPRRRPPTGVSESVLRGRRCHRQPLGPATSLPLFSTSAETKAKARKGGVPLLPGETLIPAQRRLLARALPQRGEAAACRLHGRRLREGRRRRSSRPFRRGRAHKVSMSSARPLVSPHRSPRAPTPGPSPNQINTPRPSHGQTRGAGWGANRERARARKRRARARPEG
jgi:hypothetical protein